MEPDDQVMQVTGDALAVQQPVTCPASRRVSASSSAMARVSKRLDHFRRGRRQRYRPWPPPDRLDATRVAGPAEREDRGGPERHSAP
jgi:hypothetical protein